MYEWRNVISISLFIAAQPANECPERPHIRIGLMACHFYCHITLAEIGIAIHSRSLPHLGLAISDCCHLKKRYTPLGD